MNDTYEFYGNIFLIQSADKHFLECIRKYWNRFRIQNGASKPKVIFRIVKYRTHHLKRKWSYLHNGNFLFLMNSQKYITGYFYRVPWIVHIQTPDFRDVDFLYSHLFHPVFLYLLKRLKLLQWHCAAVVKNGRGVLLAGKSGSGKTTSALSLWQNGFKILSDDTVFLTKNGPGVYAFANDDDLRVTNKTLSFFPNLKCSIKTPRYKAGHRWKRRIEVKKINPESVATRAKVSLVLFPRISKKRDTTVEPLTAPEALMKCLDQKDKEFRSLIMDKTTLSNQMELYSTLVQTAKSYDLLIGRDVESIPRLILKLL